MNVDMLFSFSMFLLTYYFRSLFWMLPNSCLLGYFFVKVELINPLGPNGLIYYGELRFDDNFKFSKSLFLALESAILLSLIFVFLSDIDFRLLTSTDLL